MPIQKKPGNLLNAPLMILRGTTTPRLNVPGHKGNEELLHTSQIKETGASPTDSV